MMVMGDHLFAVFGIAKFSQNLIRGALHLPPQRNMHCGTCIVLSKILGHHEKEDDDDEDDNNKR